MTKDELILSLAERVHAQSELLSRRAEMTTVNKILVGDCLKLLRTLKPASVHLAVVDPPFNIGYKYEGYKDALNRQDYLSWTRNWIEAVCRVLSHHGSLYVCIGDDYAAEVRLMLDEFLHRRSWVIWHYTFGVHCESKFGRDHTHILYYTSDPTYRAWNPNAIRIKSARQAKYNDKRANPNGRVPGDVWSFSRVCGTFKERTGHPCQMPVSLFERIVLASSNPGDLVLDPMCGSGASLVAAKMHGRRWLGMELSAAYADAARKRLAKTEVTHAHTG